MKTLPYENEQWFLLLKQAIAESSVTAVAKRLSEGYERTYSRPTLSQIINGIYLGKTDRVAARVMAVLDKWPCPYLNTDINADDCRSTSSGPTPSHDPAKLAHRRMCKTCKHTGENQ